MTSCFLKEEYVCDVTRSFDNEFPKLTSSEEKGVLISVSMGTLVWANCGTNWSE